MAKGKKGKSDSEPVASARPYEIMNASIVDDTCIYSYEITRGLGRGETHDVKKSKGLVKQTLKDAFAKFNVHMAFIDDVFKHSGIEVEDIDRHHGEQLSFLYLVTGFRIKGTEDNQSVILLGTKYLSAGGRMTVETPKIAIDQFSSYKWKNELAAAVAVAREEVAMYKEGNYTEVEEEVDEKELRKQQKLQFEQPSEEEVNSEFENAAL